MCTAVSYKTKDHYFGRNLDLGYSYDETVTITPRNFPFHFRRAGDLKSHYAMIGMAYVFQDYPLYYEATNEAGLSMAGLNFPGNADYKPESGDKDNILPFELIPWIIGRCRDVEEAERLLGRINLVKLPFHETMPLAPLHWMISDRTRSIVVECMKSGLNIYDNPVGVLTNNPSFDYQLLRLNDYMSLSSKNPENRFSRDLELKTYCCGMGALGLPGDSSSASRFVKAAFTKLNSVCDGTEAGSVSQFFHILGSVAMQRGCVDTGDGTYDITIYSSCCNTDKGIYYYTTYENSQITGVDMHRENLDGNSLISYPMMTGQRIRMQN